MDKFVSASLQPEPCRVSSIRIRQGGLVVTAVIIHLRKDISAVVAVISSHCPRNSAYICESGKADRLIVACQFGICNFYRRRKVSVRHVIKKYVLCVCDLSKLARL